MGLVPNLGLGQVVGPIYIGTGADGSRGHINPNVAGRDSFHDALNAAANFARSVGHRIRVDVLPGEYTNRGPVDLSNAPIELRMSRGARIVQRDLGSQFMIRLTGTESELEGGTFISETFVAGQRHILVEPDSGSVMNRAIVRKTQGIFLDSDPDNAASPYDDTDGTTKDATSMVHLDVSVSSNGIYEDCLVIPNRGVIGYRLQNGLHNTIRNLDLANEGAFFFPIVFDEARRACRIGWDIYGETGLTIENGYMRNLGTLLNADTQLEHAVRHRYPNVASTTYEYGHFQAKGCRLLDCLSPNATWYTEGMRWGSYKDLNFCFNGIASAAGSGFMAFVNAGANHIVRDIDISGHFHNWGTSGAAAIYIKGGANFNLLDVHFAEANSEAAIVVDSQAAGYVLNSLLLSAWAAHWRTTTPTNRWLINRLGSTSDAKELFVGSGAASTGDASEPIDGIYKTGATAFSVRHNVKGLSVPSTGAVYSGDIAANSTSLGS